MSNMESDAPVRYLRYRGGVTSTTAGDPHVEQLIEEVRQYTCLYNINSLKYRDQALKDECWKKISTTLYTTPGELKKEWKKLLNGYRQALITRRNSSPQKKKTIKPWKYEEQMDFLKPYICPRSPLMLYPRSPSSDFEFESILIKQENISDDENATQASTSAPRLRYRNPPLDIKLDPDTLPEPKVGEKKRKKKTKNCLIPNKRRAKASTGNSGNNRQSDIPPTPSIVHSDITLFTSSHGENENGPTCINSGNNDTTLNIANPGENSTSKATGSSNTNDVTLSSSNHGCTSSTINNPGNNGLVVLDSNPGNKDTASENTDMNASNSNSVNNINPGNNVATPSTSNNGSSPSTSSAGNQGTPALPIYAGIRGVFPSNFGNHGSKLPTRNLSKDGAYVIFLHQDPSNPENNGRENRAGLPTAKVLEYNIQEYSAPPFNSGVSGNRGTSTKNVAPGNLVHSGQAYSASQPSTSGAHGNSNQQLSAIQLFLASIYESMKQMPLKYQNNVKINSLEFLKVAEEEFEHFKVQYVNNGTNQSTSNQGTSGTLVNPSPSNSNQENNGQDTRAVPPSANSIHTTQSAIEFLGDSDQGNVALQLFLASIHESIRIMPGYLLNYMKINMMELVNTAEELSKTTEE